MVNTNWTLQEAYTANEAALVESPERSFADPTLPLYQWAALHELEHLRTRHEQGEKFALMLAIRKCANHDLIMPPWVVAGYIAAFDTILNYRSKDWNEVFGSPIPKGAHLAALRKQRKLEFAVFNEIVRIRKCSLDQAIDAGLFESVGKQFNIGKTLAEEYYYGAVAKIGWKPS
ncbi:MAG: hypothetical protein DID91_2727704424 [Candidatus Nitrotoga sp. MKT]|nr:MAG: hypothetical protein DID91_2727704424 [Candidatus Nitrotoga sp. MKT]